MMSDVNIVCDYIDNFEKKNIQVCVLASIGRSGSNLLHSLLDGHHQVLTLPTIFWYYFDVLDTLGKKFNDPDILVPYFLNKTSFSLKWYSSFFQENNEEFAKTLLEIVKKIKNLNSKNFLLAVHFAYARIKKIEISDIKVIMLHHHFPLSSFSQNALKLFKTFPFKAGFHFDNNPYLQMALSDFNDLRVIYAVRNPYDLFFSTVNASKGVEMSSHYFLNNFFAITSATFESVYIKSKLGKNVMFVRYEDMHCETVETMKSVSGFTGITYNEILLKSTFNGELWWGNNPAKKINGTDKKLINTNWLHELDSGTLNFIYNVFGTIPMYRLENDKILKKSYSDNNVFFETTIEEKRLLKNDRSFIIKNLFAGKISFKKAIIFAHFILKYKKLRNQLIRKFINNETAFTYKLN